MPRSKTDLILFFDKYGIFLIIFFAFVLRVAGINYGLPLTSLVADESALPFASLKMIQLKTLLPGLHSAEFQHILYYPPYIAYLYIFPFLLIAGLKFLTSGLPIAEFQNYIAANLSPFFIAARSINIVLAAVSIWLVYKITLNIFQNKKAAVLASFFLATSLLHMSLSMVARHWLPASFLFLLGLFFLTRPDWSFKKRYFLSVLTAGIGMGVTPITGLIGVLILLWYLFYERHGVAGLLKERFFYKLFPLFLLLAAIPVVLYPASYNFFRSSGGAEKTLLGVFASPVSFLKLAFVTEPVLMLFAVFGLVAAFFSGRKLFWTAILFIFAYSAAFYLVYWNLHRFVLPLLCLLAVFSGYGFATAWAYFKNISFRTVAVILLVMPLAVALRFSYLTYIGDSRIMARDWIAKNVPAGAKIIVAGDTRLLTTKAAVLEKRNLDPDAINKFDALDPYSDELRRGVPIFHALNLDYVDSESVFYNNPDEYIMNNNYEYLAARSDDIRFLQSDAIIKKSKVLKSFGASPDLYPHYYNEFFANPLGLFGISELGPSVTIYKIKSF